MARKFVPVVVLVCVAFALWWWLSRADKRAVDGDSAASDGGGNDQSHGRRAGEQLGQTAAGRAGRVEVRRMKSADEREQLLARIRAVQSDRDQDGGTGWAGGADDESRSPAGPRRMSSGGYKDYIQKATREIVPLIAECYEMGLERAPDLAGRITVEFTIEGEPEIGGLIGASAVDTDQSTIADAQVLECVQETMYAIEIDPPEDGGKVTVRYPFVFDPGSPDGPAGP